MKKIIFLFFILWASLSVSAQEWIYVTESSDSYWYVHSNIRRARGGYIVYVKIVPKDLNALNVVRKNNEYKRYSYHVCTELIDIDLFREKYLSIVYYDINGEVIHRISSDDDSWSYFLPDTIGESICEKVKLLVNGTTTSQ